MTAREYDVISLKTIQTNTGILPYTSLTSDGLGGTYWSTLSAPFVNGFKGISTPSTLYMADASYNLMNFYSGDGLQFIPVGPYSTSLHSYAFSEIRVPGLSSLRNLSSLTFSSLGNTLFTTISNKVLGYEIRHPTFQIGSTLLYVNDLNSTLTFVGQGDILLSSFLPTYYLGFSISSFTSTGYSALFSNISTVSTASLSTLASIYTPKNVYGLSSLQRGVIVQSNVNSTLYATTSLINAYYTSNLSLFSTITSSNISSMVNNIGSLSTNLFAMMIQNTSTTIDSYFGASSFIYKNSTFRNLYYDVINASTVIFNRFSAQVFGASTQNLLLISTFSGHLQLYSQTGQTLNAFSSLIITRTNTAFSSFSTSLTKTFSALAQTNREDYVIYPPYTVFSGVQTATGLQYDTLLSTCSVDLSGLIPYIDSNSYVFLEYTPAYAFQTLQMATNATNVYPVSTFLTYDGIIIGESVVTDWIPFNTQSLPTSNQYQEMYSRTTRMQLNIDHLLLYNTDPYIITHFHSTLMNPTQSNLFARQSNTYGGLVVPLTASNDCYLTLYTTTLWSNSMPLSGSISVHINNGIRRS
jgi:hypothetical protein